MGTPNTAARNEAANDFAADFGSAVLTILDGSTTLVSHTLSGFGVASNGVISANAISNATILENGDADGAKLTAGGLEYDLTVGTSGSDVNISNLTFVQNGTSTVNSLTVTF